MLVYILFSALLHILMVIFAEGVLFLGVLSNIELKALDGVIAKNFQKIVNAESMSSAYGKYIPKGKVDINFLLSGNIEEEKQYINYQNQIAINNFYKILCGIIIAFILVYYYIRYYRLETINWGHSIGSVILIFIFIAVYELVLIFLTILKMKHNTDSILLEVINKM
jgi:hypothetical protein